MSLSALLTKYVALDYRTADGTDEYGQPTYDETQVETTGYWKRISVLDEGAISRDEIVLQVYVDSATETEGLVGATIDSHFYELDGPAHKEWNARLARAEYLMFRVRRAVS